MNFALRSLVLRIPLSIICLRNAICEHVVPAIHRLILESLARLLSVCILLDLVVLILDCTDMIAIWWILKTLKLSVHFGGLGEFGVEIVALQRCWEVCPVDLSLPVQMNDLLFHSLIDLSADFASACLHLLYLPFIVSVLPHLVPLHGAVDVRDAVVFFDLLLSLARLLRDEERAVTAESAAARERARDVAREATVFTTPSAAKVTASLV